MSPKKNQPLVKSNNIDNKMKKSERNNEKRPFDTIIAKKNQTDITKTPSTSSKQMENNKVQTRKILSMENSSNDSVTSMEYSSSEDSDTTEFDKCSSTKHNTRKKPDQKGLSAVWKQIFIPRRTTEKNIHMDNSSVMMNMKLQQASLINAD
jgi:hypothetical protein